MRHRKVVIYFGKVRRTTQSPELRSLVTNSAGNQGSQVLSDFGQQRVQRAAMVRVGAPVEAAARCSSSAPERPGSAISVPGVHAHNTARNRDRSRRGRGVPSQRLQHHQHEQPVQQQGGR